MRMRRPVVLLPLVMVLLAAACDSPSGSVDREVELLLKLGGDNQTAAPGTQLPNPLVVAAYDFESRPISGVEVSFNVRTGAGSVSPQTVLTDENGIAQSRWTLGGSEGMQEATASVQVRGESITAEFRATAAAGATAGMPSR